MKFVVDDQVVLSREPAGPIAPHIGSFAGFVRNQGYAVSSIRRQVVLAAAFSRWLAQQMVDLRNITSDHADSYLQHLFQHLRPCRGDAAALKHLIGFLRHEGVVPPRRCQSAG